MLPAIHILGKYRLGAKIASGARGWIQAIISEELDEDKKMLEENPLERDEPQPGSSKLNENKQDEDDGIPRKKPRLTFTMKDDFVLNNAKICEKKVMKIYDIQITDWINEERVLKTIKHPNILTMFDFVKGIDHVGIVLERMDYSLRQIVDKVDVENKFSVQETTTIVSIVCEAVNFMHKMNCTHGDLHSGNILIKLDGQIKICDFGKSTFHNLNNSELEFENAVEYDKMLIANLAMELITGKYGLLHKYLDNTETFEEHLKPMVVNLPAPFQMFIRYFYFGKYMTLEECLKTWRFKIRVDIKDLARVFQKLTSN